VNSVAEGGSDGNSNPDRPNNHHPIPKFLGGDGEQELANIPSSVHVEFHSLLRQFLKEAGFDRPIGGVNGTTRLWAQDFAATPGAQDRALIQVLRASVKIDAKHGTDITQKLWKNLVEENYKSIP
jgi:hypothetical protein